MTTSPRPTVDVSVGEDGYDSSEDEDFDPTEKQAQGVSSSGSEGDEETTPAARSRRQHRGRKRQLRQDGEAEDLGFENSGDEATIRKGTKRRKKGGIGSEDDGGGDGGFVKTRSMRAIEGKGKKPLASAYGATIDVDAMWKSMIDEGSSTLITRSLLQQSTQIKSDIIMQDAQSSFQPSNITAQDDNTIDIGSEEMVTIQTQYEFAGKTEWQTKIVPKSSREAQRYLQTRIQSTAPQLFTPLRRISKWDPNPEGIVNDLPAWPGRRSKATEIGKSDWPKAQKLNVVDKSKLDWKAHVAKEGHQDELEKAAKAKDAYLSKADFLGQVEVNRQEELRNARKK